MLSVVVFDFTIAVSHTQCQWKVRISWHIPLILSGNQANIPSSWHLSLPFCPPIPKPTLPGNLVTREFFSTPTRAGVGHGGEHWLCVFCNRPQPISAALFHWSLYRADTRCITMMPSTGRTKEREDLRGREHLDYHITVMRCWRKPNGRSKVKFRNLIGHSSW